jgi:endonuclease/exonuclease/phosphatase family metal-dependent hydrolase
MTFNILRQAWAGPNAPQWEVRKPAAAAVLAEIRPDLLGLQEETDPQLRDLLDADPELQLAGARPIIGGSILYRRAKFAMEQFGLVAVPERIKEPGNRAVQWALFRKLDTGTRILFYNAHLSPFEEPARVKGMEIMLEHLRAFPNPYDYVFMVGDLNASEANDTIRLLFAHEKPRFRSAWRDAHGFKDQAKTAKLVGAARDAAKRLAEAEKAGKKLPPETVKRLEADIAASPEGTFHGYSPRVRPGPIDYILVPPNVKVLKCEILTGEYKGVIPSDHYPIWADVTLLSGPR